MPVAPNTNPIGKEENMRRNVNAILLLACLMVAAVAAADGDGRAVVNINTATAEQLQLLPRVGPTLAARIIDYRESNGPFESVDEIVAVKGIGETAFQRLEPYLVTSGATTLEEKVPSPRSRG
jgi:competence protein ComEA